MERSTPRPVIDAFHGKIPRLYWRLLSGRPEVWGRAARQPRQAIFDVLAPLGLTLRLVERVEVFRRSGNPGHRTICEYRYQVGELTHL